MLLVTLVPRPELSKSYLIPNRFSKSLRWIFVFCLLHLIILLKELDILFVFLLMSKKPVELNFCTPEPLSTIVCINGLEGGVLSMIFLLFSS